MHFIAGIYNTFFLDDFQLMVERSCPLLWAVDHTGQLRLPRARCQPLRWRVLDKCRNTRNLGEYEGMLDVDERLVNDLVGATTAVSRAIQG